MLYGTTATNGQLKVNWPNKVLAGDITPGFTIDLAHKDLTLIVDAANAAKVPMPLAAAAREAFSAARAARLRRSGLLRHGGRALRHRRYREASAPLRAERTSIAGLLRFTPRHREERSDAATQWLGVWPQ